MSRRTANTAGAQPIQIKHLAFNTQGHAIPDPCVNRNVNETILCYWSKSTSAIDGVIAKMTKEGKVVHRTSLAYTERELEDIEPGLGKFLVVGYALQDHRKVHESAAPDHHKQSGTGSKILDEVIPLGGETPILVVAEITTEQVDSMQLWALLCPRNGICTPYQVSQARVFYRYEFRDATTAIKERPTKWGRAISAISVRPGDGGLSLKQERLKKAKDTAKVVLEPEQSFIAELLCLLRAFQKSKDAWHLKEMQKLLTAADEDLNLRPLPKNAGLRKFVEGHDEFDASDAEMVVQEVTEMWPEVEDVTVDSVLKLRKGIQDGDGTYLEYRLVRGFLAEGSYRISIGESVDTAMVCRIIGTLKRTTPEWTLPIPTDDDNALFAVILAKLKEIVAAGKRFDAELEKICGDVMMFNGPHDAWEAYSGSPDTDHAKLAFYGVIRYVIRALKDKIGGTDIMVEELVEVMERLWGNLGRRSVSLAFSGLVSRSFVGFRWVYSQARRI
ncbi:hypothetical protein VE02_06281 [Pseudogymnoascus sp. 03VT05]|nr:hypothetical protein VE02_06281 [Pseudogymnoascus sp. 03VT05]